MHPDDLMTAVPMALDMMSTGSESIENPSAAFAAEIPIRITRKDGGHAAMALSGRVLDESGRLLCVLRPSAERYALDSVLRQLSSGADLVTLLDAVVELLLTQFQVPAAWVVSADGELVDRAQLSNFDQRTCNRSSRHSRQRSRSSNQLPVRNSGSFR